MAREFCLYIAGRDISVSPVYEETERIFARLGYVKDSSCGCSLFIVISISDIEEERKHAECEMPNAVLEYYAIHRKLAEKLYLFSAALLHGAAISYKNKGYLFSAPSGTGKTTHISLWRKYVGDAVDIINGDKPIYSDGNCHIYGTPWAGKENMQKNVSYPLGGICFIKRGKDNTVRRLEKTEALSYIFPQCYMPISPDGKLATLDILGRLIETVPFYLLSCDISKEAAAASFEAMTGERMP